MSIIDNGRESLTGLTLEAVLGIKKQMAPTPSQANRTLLDIIRDEDRHRSVLGNKDKKSWKGFGDWLWLKKAGANVNGIGSIQVSSSNSTQVNDSRPQTMHEETNSGSNMDTVRLNSVPSSNSTQFDSTNSDSVGFNSVQTSNSTQLESDTSITRGVYPPRSFGELLVSDSEGNAGEVAREGTRRLSVALAEERAISERETVVAREESEPVRMSLMELLEETDGQMMFVGSMMNDGVDDDNDDDHGQGHEQHDDHVVHTCCVCMVRPKGAAFIPCGHTFCRLCSREVWVQRGNCPLCNSLISEVLDIF